MAPAPLSTGLHSFTLLPTIKLPPPPVLVPEWVGLCTLQAPVGLSNDFSWRLGVSPAAAPTSTGVFNQRFEALFHRAGALGYLVCFTPLRSSRFICARVWGHGYYPALCLPRSPPL